MCARRRSATPEDDTQRHAFTVSFDDDHHLVSGLLIPKSVGVGVDVGDLYSIELDDDIASRWGPRIVDHIEQVVDAVDTVVAGAIAAAKLMPGCKHGVSGSRRGLG